MKKISIIGATLWGNRGAEAMLVTTIGKVREKFPDVKIVIHSYFPQKDRALCLDKSIDIVSATPFSLVLVHFPFAFLDKICNLIGLNWPRFLMPKSIRELAQSDLLLDIFGISYSDGREKFLPFNVLSNWPAMLMDVPVVKLSQGLGSFKNPLTKNVSKWMLNKCAHVFARGQMSQAMAAELDNGKLSMSLAADIAFLYNPKYSLTSENNAFVEDICRKIKTAEIPALFSVSSVVHGKCQKKGLSYPAIIAQHIRCLINHDCTVVLLPNATRQEAETTRNNDIAVIKLINKQLSSEEMKNVISIEKDINTDSIKKIMELCQVVVASRFHAMIAAISLAKPLLVFGWGHKYEEVLAMAQIQEQAYDFKMLDSDKIDQAYSFLLNNKEKISSKIKDALPEINSVSQKQFDWLDSHFNQKTN